MVYYLSHGHKSDAGTSSFQSFAMALAGRIGTGAIAGVATAIFYGGPGAVFWMWMIGLLGAATAFCESTLGQIYKERVKGEYRGGPAFYISKGLPKWASWLGPLFAVLACISKGFCEGPVQSHAISSAMNEAFGIPMVASGIAVAVLLAFIILGGMRRIATFAQFVVPFMTVAYVIVMVIVLGANIGQVPAMFGLIFQNAFALDPLIGGIFGYTVLWGVKRGVYSSEAGLGTGAQAAAAAEVSHPVKQGLAQAFSVYCDILLAATSTALMILVTDCFNVVKPKVSEAVDGWLTQTDNFFVLNLPGVEPGPNYPQAAVNSVLPGFGGKFVAVALLFFAFTTIVSFAFYADTNVAFLFKESRWYSVAQYGIKIVLIGMVVFGSVRSNDVVWNLADIGVGLNVWVNLIGITLLSGVVAKAMKDFTRQRKLGLDPVFDPDEAGIRGAELWKAIVAEKYQDQAAANAARRELG
jgi:AGCS family alanine or glycine:cation symporter